jgi:hypothetical protein
MKFTFWFLALWMACLPATAGKLYTLEAIGEAESPPQLFHIMMKVEADAALAADAAASGEKRLREFLAAADALAVPGLTWRIHNNLFNPAPTIGRTGNVYARNVVFTLPDPPTDLERNRIISRIQDLGAKFNSHCVTCIGSG